MSAFKPWQEYYRSLIYEETPTFEQPYVRTAEEEKLLERLKRKITADDETECWCWNGSKDKKGYGKARVNGKLKYVRRVLFELCERPITKGKNICNTCSDKFCVNPAHQHIGMHTTFDWDTLEVQLAEKAAMAGFDRVPTLETSIQ